MVDVREYLDASEERFVWFAMRCEDGPRAVEAAAEEIHEELGTGAYELRDAMLGLAREWFPDSLAAANLHDRQECGCYASYEERADLFLKGILWLQNNRGKEGAIEFLNGRHDELNRRWCEEDLDAFRDWWREVLRAA